MGAIFLSASVPIAGRGEYFKTADPFLIQAAVRELVAWVIRTEVLVWGGHPAITPMIWSVCEDLGSDYSKAVILYQSRFFQDRFPEENDRFNNVVFTEAIENDRDSSLAAMREAMISRSDLTGAVFIGGMEGVRVEHEMFGRYHPNERMHLVASPGGATLELAEEMGQWAGKSIQDVDFATMFRVAIPRPRHDQGT